MLLLTTAGIGKKLVTAFAVVEKDHVWEKHTTSQKDSAWEALAQKSNGPTLGKANAVPWQLANRDNFVAKEPGPVAGWSALPTLSPHTSNRYA